MESERNMESIGLEQSLIKGEGHHVSQTRMILILKKKKQRVHNHSFHRFLSCSSDNLSCVYVDTHPCSPLLLSQFISVCSTSVSSVLSTQSLVDKAMAHIAARP